MPLHGSRRNNQRPYAWWYTKPILAAGVKRFPYVNNCFCCNKFAFALATWAKTLYHLMFSTFEKFIISICLMVSILYGVYFNVKEFYRAEFNINQSKISVDLQGVFMKKKKKKYRRVHQHRKLLWEIAVTFNRRTARSPSLLLEH